MNQIPYQRGMYSKGVIAQLLANPRTFSLWKIYFVPLSTNWLLPHVYHTASPLSSLKTRTQSQTENKAEHYKTCVVFSLFHFNHKSNPCVFFLFSKEQVGKTKQHQKKKETKENKQKEKKGKRRKERKKKKTQPHFSSVIARAKML